jgi:hypothetical protein
MRKVYLQYWEESERGWGVRPDGCSLHLTLDEHKKYIKSIYDGREEDTEVPDEYERIVGEPIEVMIDPTLFSIVEGTLRLFQYEMNNLIKLEELVIICDI